MFVVLTKYICLSTKYNQTKFNYILNVKNNRFSLVYEMSDRVVLHNNSVYFFILGRNDFFFKFKFTIINNKNKLYTHFIK